MNVARDQHPNEVATHGGYYGLCGTTCAHVRAARRCCEQLERLPLWQPTRFSLRLMEGMSLEEIGEVLGI